jgi:hypothetical protein
VPIRRSSLGPVKKRRLKKKRGGGRHGRIKKEREIEREKREEKNGGFGLEIMIL